MAFEEKENAAVNEDDWSIEDLFPDEEVVVEEAEHELDKVIQNQSRAIRKIAERQARTERQSEIEKLTSEFYASADETERELADVLLPGLSEPDKVKKALDLAKAKAKALRPKEEDSEDAAATEAAAAFTPPVGNAPPRVDDPMAKLAERTRKGDARAAFEEFFILSGGLPKKK